MMGDVTCSAVLQLRPWPALRTSVDNRRMTQDDAHILCRVASHRLRAQKVYNVVTLQDGLSIPVLEILDAVSSGEILQLTRVRVGYVREGRGRDRPAAGPLTHSPAAAVK